LKLHHGHLQTLRLAVPRGERANNFERSEMTISGYVDEEKTLGARANQRDATRANPHLRREKLCKIMNTNDGTDTEYVARCMRAGVAVRDCQNYATAIAFLVAATSH